MTRQRRLGALIATVGILTGASVVSTSRPVSASAAVFVNLNQGLPPNTNIVPMGLNNLGQVVGMRQDFPQQGRGFLWINGAYTDLGTLGGFSIATGINDAGQVVGYSADTTGCYRAVLWSAGHMTDIGGLPGAVGAMATAINREGDVVGISTTTPYGCDYPDPGHAVLWRNGVVTDLGTLGGNYSYATGVNDSDQIVGYSTLAGGLPGQYHAFLWSQGSMTDLGTLPGGSWSQAFGINNSGEIVGVAGVPDPAYSYAGRPFLWTPASGMTDLGSLPAAGANCSNAAYGINDSGEIVGRSCSTTSIKTTPVVWMPQAAPIDVGGGGDDAWAVNQSGQFVGRNSTPTAELGFLAYLPGIPLPPLTPRFTWAMVPRFGVDPTTHLPTYPATVAPATFTVDFDACDTTGPAAEYRWSIGSTLIGTSGNCSGFRWSFPQGSQTVTLTITDSTRTVAASTSQTIAVRDYLVVSMGDSVASGEGNPDVPGDCALAVHSLTISCTQLPLWRPQPPSQLPCEPQASCNQNLQCDRSTIAGPAQAADALESGAPAHHYSVTFVHLACSGATILWGLLNPYYGINPQPSPVPAQIDQAESLIAGRRVDALTLSIGANDVGFRDIVEQCLPPGSLRDQCPTPSEIDRRLVQLSQGLDHLATCLNTSYCNQGHPGSQQGLGVPPGHVYLTQYLDPSRDGQGKFCSPDAEYIFSLIVKPLNDLLAAKALQYGWHFVDGIANVFQIHGICAPSDQTWVRTLRESLQDEGSIDGVFHPSAAGQAWYGSRLLMYLHTYLTS